MNESEICQGRKKKRNKNYRWSVTKIKWTGIFASYGHHFVNLEDAEKCLHKFNSVSKYTYKTDDKYELITFERYKDRKAAYKQNARRGER